jgi:hypothetical protein
LYEDTIDVLRRLIEINDSSNGALRELVVLERECATKARYMKHLILRPGFRDQVEQIEGRIGFDDFYRTVRLVADALSSISSDRIEECAFDILEWVSCFIERHDVHSRDEEKPYSEENCGAPIRYSWMRLQEKFLQQSSITEALAMV